MNMIEKVARGLAQKHYEKRFHVNKIDQIKINVEGNWNIFIDEAKAAIAAMREPSEEMLSIAKYHVFIERYQAMIDAALKE